MSEEMKPQGNKQEMVKGTGPQAKMVKIVAKRPIRLMRRDDYGKEIETIYKEGDSVMVTEDEALEFCKPIKGQYGYSGERYEADGDIPRHNLQRAVRAS